MIHVCTPYSLDKNLAKAYNEAFERCPENDWLCLIDYDVCFLTPDAIRIMHEYVEAFPDTGIFTCFTNRIHPLQVEQNYLGAPSDNTDMKYWVNLATEQSKASFSVYNIEHEISGFLMLISKKTWNKIKFQDNGKCLGVDNQFSQAVIDAGLKILCMNRIIVWHTYRINDITDKSHLK